MDTLLFSMKVLFDELSPDERKALVSHDNQQVLRIFLQNPSMVINALFPSLALAGDFIPDGGGIAVINNVPQDVAPYNNLNVSELERVSFLDEDDHISG